MAEQKITSRAKSIITYIAIIILWSAAIIRLVLSGPHRTGMGINLTSILLLTMIVKLLGQIPFDICSCFLLFPMLMVEMLTVYRYINRSACLVLFLLLDVCLILIWQNGRVREYFMGISATMLAAVAMVISYETVAYKLLPIYFKLFRLSLSAFQKSILIAGFGVLFIMVFTLCFKILGRLLQRWREPIVMIFERFYGLEIYVLILVAFTIILLTVMEYVSSFSVFRMMPSFMWIEFFFIFMSVAYICLLIKTVSIKEKMQITQNDKNMACAYRQDIETALEDMREVRHDVKNLFLTMGGFVERSDDSEMKEFYKQNVVPFMEEALVKNELQDKLKILEEDSLKSFLYYKIIEKAARGIYINLEITSRCAISGGYGDIVRLLGILIDNAAEEAELSGGAASVGITEDKAGINIRVANSVRPEVRIRGVVAGTSDKGEGRGRGLVIAEKIVSKYDNIILNSYFTQTDFVQYIMIIKS